IMLGENLIAKHDHLRYVGATYGDFWASWNGGASHATTIIPINTPIDENLGFMDCSDPPRAPSNWNVSWGFKSNHTGGVNFCFADGSVHFVNQNIDHQIYQYLGCKDDSQTVQLP